MSKKPLKPIDCFQCGRPFFRNGRRDRHCSLRCKITAYSNRARGQGPKGDCWEWAKSRNSHGYGTVKAQGRQIGAHQASYELFVGPIPAGLCVLHKCDNPPCVRPDHLFVGTNTENVADRNYKKRQACGQRHGLAKLSDNDVRCIRKGHETEGISQAELAKTFGVSRPTISRILTRKAWQYT